MGKEGEVSIFGLTFPRGEAVTIPADNQAALAKIATHPEFEIVSSSRPTLELKKK